MASACSSSAPDSGLAVRCGSMSAAGKGAQARVFACAQVLCHCVQVQAVCTRLPAWGPCCLVTCLLQPCATSHTAPHPCA